jgi:hypothetical protein
MPIVTKKVLFVIDISNSMLDEIRVKRGRGEAKDLQFQSSPKLDLAREELASALRALDDNTFFNICAFETDVRPWQKEPVKATKERVQEAIRWIEGQKPATPNNSRSMRQSDGLNADGMMAGRTNTYAALKYIFGFPPANRRRAPAVPPAIRAKRAASAASTPVSSSPTVNRPKAKRRTSTKIPRT